MVVRFGKYQGVQNASDIRIELQRETGVFFREVSLNNFHDEGKVIPHVLREPKMPVTVRIEASWDFRKGNKSS